VGRIVKSQRLALNIAESALDGCEDCVGNGSGSRPAR